MADYVIDRFDGDDDDLIDGRAFETAETWDVVVSAMKIGTNRAKCSTDGVRAIAVVDTRWADASVEVNLRCANGEAGYVGLVLRYTDTDNYWLFGLYHTGGNAFRLWERNGGVETLRAFANPGFSTGSDIKVRAVCDGSTITITATQGVSSLQIQYASATFNQTETAHGIMVEKSADYVEDFLVWEGPGVPPPNPLYAGMNLTTPATLQVFQRSGDVGSIVIAGTVYTETTCDIEASWNGGAFVMIDEDSTGVFSGTLADQPQGQGTLTVRVVADPDTSATVEYVGIGDIFVIAGQSNASGRGTDPQSWSHATLVPAQFGNNYAWAQLAAINDSNVAQVDAVSSDASAAENYFPRLATAIMGNQNVPVAFVPCAMGATAIISWLPGVDHQDRATLYGSMVYRALQVGGVKAVIFHQGESDATITGFTGGATYQSRLVTLADAIFADLAVPTVVCRIHCWNVAPSTSQANVDEINDAMAAATNESGHVWLGPNFDKPNPVTTGLHFVDDADMIDAASRLWAALDALFYGGPPVSPEAGIVIAASAGAILGAPVIGGSAGALHAIPVIPGDSYG